MILVAVMAMMMSCAGNSNSKNEQKEAAPLKEQAAQKAPACCTALQGVYKGTLPAASSPGIKTELTLNEDKTFNWLSEYMEEENGNFQDKGTYCVSENILTTTSEKGTVSYFKVEDNQLRMLDKEKKEIFGELAEMYVLKKAN